MAVLIYALAAIGGLTILFVVAGAGLWLYQVLTEPPPRYPDISPTTKQAR